LQFNKRIVESYPELFSQTSEEGTDSRTNFGKKWGSYSEIITLAQGDIRRLNEISALPLHQCLMFLAYEKEKAELEQKLMKQSFKR
jgi:hypothetical protein